MEGNLSNNSPQKETRKNKRHRGGRDKVKETVAEGAKLKAAVPETTKLKVAVPEPIKLNDPATEVARPAQPMAQVSNGKSIPASHVIFDLDESSTSNEENTEAEEEIGPLRSVRAPLSTQSSYEVSDILMDPALHTPNMSNLQRRDIETEVTNYILQSNSGLMITQVDEPNKKIYFLFPEYNFQFHISQSHGKWVVESKATESHFALKFLLKAWNFDSCKTITEVLDKLITSFEKVPAISSGKSSSGATSLSLPEENKNEKECCAGEDYQARGGRGEEGEVYNLTQETYATLVKAHKKLLKTYNDVVATSQTKDTLLAKYAYDVEEKDKLIASLKLDLKSEKKFNDFRFKQTHEERVFLNKENETLQRLLKQTKQELHTKKLRSATENLSPEELETTRLTQLQLLEEKFSKMSTNINVDCQIAENNQALEANFKLMQATFGELNEISNFHANT